LLESNFPNLTVEKEGLNLPLFLFGRRAVTKPSRYIFISSVILLSVTKAGAQYTYTPPVYTPLQAITADVAGQGFRSSMQNSGDASDEERTTQAATSASPKFTVDKSRTRANLSALASRLDPANAQQAEQLFASNDVIGMVQGVMNQYGLQKNNVAHAYALYWVVYWGLANNVHEAPSERALQAVAAQAERGFAANAEFAQLDNAAKQAAAEELMALTAIFDATSEQAKSDPALAAQIAKASLEGSHKSGLELDRMILTDNGFMPR
jgi:hypothetical protein